MYKLQSHRYSFQSKLFPHLYATFIDFKIYTTQTVSISPTSKIRNYFVTPQLKKISNSSENSYIEEAVPKILISTKLFQYFPNEKSKTVAKLFQNCCKNPYINQILPKLVQYYSPYSKNPKLFQYFPLLKYQSVPNSLY